MDNPFKSPVILSFCPGFLGLERGLDRALSRLRFGKATVAAYVEIEAFICANLVAAMEAGVLDAAPIWTDVKTFDPLPFREKVHGLIGGYPCQPFSVAGKQQGEDDPRHLWPYISKHIEAIRPVWCFFENVRGHLTLGFDEVYRSLSGMGYAVECGIFTAEEVGAPHQRERLFILAIRKNFLAYTKYDGGDGAKTIRIGIKASHDNEEGQKKSIQFTGDSGRNGYAGIQGCELADTVCNGSGRNDTGGLQPEIIRGGEELADTNDSGSEQDWQPAELRTGGTQQSPGNSWGSETGENIQGGWNRWPARPGEPQHEWEEPRTVESGVGSTVDGYNFREDLLRAYGNSVVEQTAELAFITLLNKHLNAIL